MINNITELATAKGYSLVLWNSRSLLNKIEELDRLAMLGKPDFIAITESWLNPLIDTELVDIDGYNVHRFDRTIESGKTSGGGLLFYYLDDTRCIPLNNLSYCDRHIEMLFVQLSLPRSKKIYYGLVY